MLLSWRYTRNIDYWLLGATVAAMIISIILVFSASPIIAKRISISEHYFILHHIIYILVSLFLIITLALIEYKLLIRCSFIGFVICILLLMLVLKYGVEIKGAKRWLHFLKFSLQPSEFIKPFFAVVTASILSFDKIKQPYIISLMVYLIVVILLLLQPDFSMSIIITLIWLGQLFIFGIPYIWIAIIAVILLSGATISYFTIPYIKNRIYSFFDPDKYENFQINKSVEAFKMGKLLGVGPGEGRIKLLLPDCHADFIFAVAAEEFGAIFCLLMLIIFGFIIIRIWYFAYCENSSFNLLIISGLLVHFSMQFFINVAVVLNLLPTTGLALPLISYGGSSLLAISISIGIVLSISKNRRITKRIDIN